MTLQYYLRLALVGLTLSVVGCLPDVSIGDITDDSKIKTPVLENFDSVNLSIPNPVRNTFQRNIKQFNRKYQLPWINSASYNLRNDGNSKTPSFSPTDTRASADVTYKVQSNVNSRNNPVVLSSVTFNDGIDAKRSYALQTVQQERNPFAFKGSQMSSSDVNLALGHVRENGGMHATNVYRSGSFGYQHTSKLEMHPESSQSFGLNEPYLRENIPINHMSRSSTVNHMRHKSDGNMLFNHFLQNNGQNQNMLRSVVPANTSPSFVRTKQEGKPLPQAFPAGTGVISQISYENMRNVALSKMFTPPTIPTPIYPAFKGSNSIGGHSVLPLKKSLMFSSQHDHAKLSNTERPASPKANPRSTFDYGNTKSATSSYTFKDIQLTSTQNGYQNRRQSSQNVAPIHNEQKYNNLATGISAIRPSVTNNARSYFLSDENSGTQMSALLNRSKQNTDLTSRLQFAKNTKLTSERNTNINLPNSTNNSLMKPSQHTIRNRTALNSFGQSTVQLSVKHYPAPSLVPSSAMKSVHSFNPSVSGTQGTSKNSDTSSSRNRPYYLTSKKPYGFKGFSFVPTLQTSLQKTEMHSLPNSSPNVQYSPARPRTALSALAQKPLIRERNEKTPFQYKDIETSQEKQPYRDQTDSFDNRPQHGTVSSTEGASNPMSFPPKYHVRGQAVVMKTSLSGTNTTNNGAVDVVQSKTSQRWTSNRLTSAQHTESNQDELPKLRSLNGRFVGSNSYEASIKSINSHKNPTSELILPFHKASLMNKVTGYPQIHNAVIQPLRRYSLKEHEGLLNPSSEEINDTTTAGITQSNVTENYSPIKWIPTSSVVIGRQVELRTDENSNQQNIYAIPTSQSPIYRSADVNTSAKHTFQSPIYRSGMKPFGEANILQANAVSTWRNGTSQNSETDIDLNAVGVSQASRPTSSFVVAKYIKTSDKASAKLNLIMSSTKTVLNHYKPVRFSDIAGSASFANIKPRSADTMTKEDLRSDQNISNSTPMMEESFKRVFLDSSFMISSLQNETDESAVDLSFPELMPTAAIDLTTQSQPSFTEEHTLPQPTAVYSSKSHLDPEDHITSTAEDIDLFYEGTLMSNTTLLVKITSG